MYSTQKKQIKNRIINYCVPIFFCRARLDYLAVWEINTTEVGLGGLGLRDYFFFFFLIFGIIFVARLAKASYELTSMNELIGDRLWQRWVARGSMTRNERRSLRITNINVGEIQKNI